MNSSGDNTQPSHAILPLANSVHSTFGQQRALYLSPTVCILPLDNRLALASKRLPASTTTVVVPSPASMSWALDSSTSCSKFEII